MLLKLLAKIIVMLNSNTSSNQVAAGLASGLLFALLPAGNLLWIALFFAAFFSKAHYGMLMLASAGFKLLLPLLSGPLDALGWFILNLPALEGGFTWLYNQPIAPLTRFNNTLVMGGLAAGLALWLPAFFAFRSLIRLYRRTLAEKLAASKFMLSIKKLPLVKALSGAIKSVQRVQSALE
jgi:uncharacterized protein (TIGR03546 family)